MGFSVNWQDAAACRGWPTSWWFPDKRLLPEHREAITICYACTVRPACLNEALQRGHQGTWGGITQHERKIAARRLRLNERTNRAGDP